MANPSAAHAISCPLCFWTMSGTGADAPKLLFVRLSAHFAVLHPSHDFPPDPRFARSPLIAASDLLAAEQVARRPAPGRAGPLH